MRDEVDMHDVMHLQGSPAIGLTGVNDLNWMTTRSQRMSLDAWKAEERWRDPRGDFSHAAEGWAKRWSAAGDFLFLQSAFAEASPEPVDNFLRTGKGVDSRCIDIHHLQKLKQLNIRLHCTFGYNVLDIRLLFILAVKPKPATYHGVGFSQVTRLLNSICWRTEETLQNTNEF